MSILHDSDIDALLTATSVFHDQTLEQMETRASQEGFPTVGREVGSFLQWLVITADLTRIYECGSGFGYSAYWMATALPDDGEIVLTEVDEDELEDARSFLGAGAIKATVRYHHGDALEALADANGKFDLVLLDHENERYREGFEVAETRLTPGGVIVADNVMHSFEFGPADLAAVLEDEDAEIHESSLAGIVEYVRFVRSRPDFSSVLLPIGEGLVLSTHDER